MQQQHHDHQRTAQVMSHLHSRKLENIQHIGKKSATCGTNIVCSFHIQ